MDTRNMGKNEWEQKANVGAGEMAQQLRAHNALAEDLDSVPKHTHVGGEAPVTAVGGASMGAVTNDCTYIHVGTSS